MQRFDLIVIGTGLAGNGAAHCCRQAGWRVAVVDDEPYGGTCPLRGCDPKKVLVGGAELVDWQRRMTGWGVAGEARLDWPARPMGSGAGQPQSRAIRSLLRRASRRTLSSGTRRQPILVGQPVSEE